MPISTRKGALLADFSSFVPVDRDGDFLDEKIRI
jgi:hypothetical protein